MSYKKNAFYVSYLFILIFIHLSCNTHFQKNISKQQNISIQPDSINLYDSNAHYLIEPYRLELNTKMNEIIGFTQTSLIKEKPSGTLNNFMADACLKVCKTKFNIDADFAVLNYGGIRVPSIPAGNISLGKIYELMPFDNQLVCLKITGKTVLQLMQLIASQNGWPISGAKLHIRNKAVVDVAIQHTSLDTNKIYSIITSDYIANGGDKAYMLKDAKERKELNYLLRDALIDHLKSEPNFIPSNDERITIEP